METMTTAQLFGSEPRVLLTSPAQWPVPNPGNLWVNYDAETDSLILYLTGKPVRGVHVWLQDDIYLIVDPVTNAIVGMYVEAWERSFVPAHADLQQTWRQIKPTIVPDGWSQLLRMLALWLFLIMQPPGNGGQSTLQPA